MELNLTGSKKTIFELLQTEPNLSLKQIHLRLNKKGTQITNQGTFKLLKELLKNKTIQKNEKLYSINPEWIKKTKQYLETIEKEMQSTIPSLEKLQTMNYFTHTFTSIMDLADFITDYCYNFPAKNKPLICLFKHMYSLIGLSEHQMNKFPDGRKKPVIMVTHTDSKWEDFFEPMYKKMHWKIFRGYPICNECDWIIIGDYVFRIYFDTQHKKEWVAFIYSIGDKINLKPIFEHMHNIKRDFIITMEKNEKIAEQIRKETLELIEKEL